LADFAPSTRGVAFEVDHHRDRAETGWSVIVRGRVDALMDPSIELPADTRPRQMAAVSRNLFLRLTPESFTGRGVHRT
jgi:hypothetical protein